MSWSLAFDVKDRRAVVQGKSRRTLGDVAIASANGNGQGVATLQVLEEGHAHEMGVDVDSHGVPSGASWRADRRKLRLMLMVSSLALRLNRGHHGDR
jgi:hypothetical protein